VEGRRSASDLNFLGLRHSAVRVDDKHSTLASWLLATTPEFELDLAALRPDEHVADFLDRHAIHGFSVY
jgi:hypothetical protein